VYDSFLRLLRRTATCLYRCLLLAEEELIDIVLYLRSVTGLIVQPFLEADEDEIDLTSLSTAEIRELYAAGAYFRDDDGPLDLMAAMNLSWQYDIVENLDASSELPIAAARNVIATVESRPLTNGRLALQYSQILPAWHASHSFEPGIPCVHLPPHLVTFSRSLVHRRLQLLSILSTSVEWNEPLVCSTE
jgi:hypothetical protein